MYFFSLLQHVSDDGCKRLLDLSDQWKLKSPWHAGLDQWSATDEPHQNWNVVLRWERCVPSKSHSERVLGKSVVWRIDGCERVRGLSWLWDSVCLEVCYRSFILMSIRLQTTTLTPIKFILWRLEAWSN